MGQSTQAGRVNRYPADCAECGVKVPAGEGVLSKESGKWITRHRDGECGGQAEPKVPAVKLTPTGEQQECIDLFAEGDSMVIEAGAGTGKTATLKLLAESTTKRCQYLAFNRAIVEEAGRKFPEHVACNTAHSLAFRAIGKGYSHRLNGARMPSDVVARMLHIQPVDIRVGDAKRTLAAGYLAGHVLTAVGNFCKSADLEPARKHIGYIDGIDVPTVDGRRTFANNDDIARYLLPFVRKAWEDLRSKEGQLRFGHDHYLKMFQLSNPRIDAEVIFFDEAQDANPVMAAIVAAQTHAQVVYVGDSQQAIYEFTGAVNTLANLDSDHRVFLTQSFRFGQAVADIANVVLERLEAELRLVGTPNIESSIGLLENENAILTRTNATAVEAVLTLQEQGRRPHLVGGGKEVLSFAKGAQELMDFGHTAHPELACFDSWNAVTEYVAHDAQGSELKLMVKLIDKFGTFTILRALDHMPAERQADVIVSTAHKAKGREWDRVRLGGDFPTGEEDKEISVAEMRLLYVACTRARLQLDMSAVAAFFEEGDDEEGDELAELLEEAGELADDVTRWVDGIES